MTTVEVTMAEEDDGWTAAVTVRGDTTTTHRVHVSRAEHARYGGGAVTDLVRRSLAFLLAREPNTSILPAFSLSDIERYFPEFRASIPGR
jgi:hypothetical protein